MNNNAINNIVIVGNNISAWTVASALVTSFSTKDMSITLVGELTKSDSAISLRPKSLDFHKLLKLDERHLMKNTSASFKLATNYLNWNEEGHQCIQPLGTAGVPTDLIDFHHYVSKKRLSGSTVNPMDYSFCAIAAMNNKFAHPNNDPKSILSTIDYSLHLSKQDYLNYIKHACTEFGVKHINSNYKSAVLDSNGFIKSINLNNDQCISGQLFIDCSGAEGNLIHKALGSEYESWSDWLPINCKAEMVFNQEAQAEIAPYTSILGTESGWLEQVQLFNKISRRYFYNSELTEFNDIKSFLNKGLDNSFDIITTKVFPGQRKKHWLKNCIALGDSAGNVDFLEMSNLEMVEQGIQRLLKLFPDQTFNESLINEYNSQTLKTYNNIRDYIILHTGSVIKEKSEFWSKFKLNKPPESLTHRAQLFKNQGQLAFNQYDSFQSFEWANAFMNLNFWPNGYTRFIDAFSLDELSDRYALMKNAINENVQSMPGHRHYIQQYINSIN